MAAGVDLPAAVQRRGVKLAQELGATAIPLLARKLRGEDEREASWAYYLLARVGGERAAEAARALALDERLSDGKKALALALLGEMGAELPDSIHLGDPRALRERSVRDLAQTLTGPAEVARAADLLVDQVLPDELAEFVADMAEVAPESLAPLVDELLLRDDVTPDALDELSVLRLRLGRLAPLPSPAASHGRRTVLVGAHTDGRRAVLVAQERRALLAVIDHGGRLARASHDDNLAKSGVARLTRDLEKQGFALARDSLATAAELVADAARAGRSSRGRLPRDYYLGRDLLGLYDEHVPAARRKRVSADPARWWDMALTAQKEGKLGGCYLALRAYLARRDRAAGAAERARAARRYLKLFERYARLEHPDSPPEALARGEELFDRSCDHLEAGRLIEAVSGFEAVIKLVPTHYASWGNLGAAYARIGRREDALRCLRQALSVRPDYSVALHNLAALERQ